MEEEEDVSEMPGGKDEEDALRKKALESMAKKRRTG